MLSMVRHSLVNKSPCNASRWGCRSADISWAFPEVRIWLFLPITRRLAKLLHGSILFYHIDSILFCFFLYDLNFLIPLWSYNWREIEKEWKGWLVKLGNQFHKETDGAANLLGNKALGWARSKLEFFELLPTNTCCKPIPNTVDPRCVGAPNTYQHYETAILHMKISFTSVVLVATIQAVQFALHSQTYRL